MKSTRMFTSNSDGTAFFRHGLGYRLSCKATQGRIAILLHFHRNPERVARICDEEIATSTLLGRNTVFETRLRNFERIGRWVTYNIIMSFVQHFQRNSFSLAFALEYEPELSTADAIAVTWYRKTR